MFSASESQNASNEKNTIALNDCMFTYAQVDCQECWRKELQVRKAFGDINTANVLYFAKKAEQSNSRAGSGAMCHRGQNQTSEASEEK